MQTLKEFIGKIIDAVHAEINTPARMARKRFSMTEQDHFKKIIHKGEGIFFDKGFNVFNGHANIFLGSHVHLVDVLLNAGDTIGKITIDDYVFFGHGAKLSARGHNYHVFNAERQQQVIEKPIHIKTGAWIGSGAIILGGVTIGMHSVIGAGSIVVKDIPDYAVAVGNPAQVIKYITNQTSDHAV